MDLIKTGIYEQVLYPPLDYPMIGYIQRTGRSQGTLDPLYVRALYMECSGTSAFLISCDFMALRSDFCVHMAKQIEKETGVKASNIIICCTHTHSGPDTMAREQETEAYRQWMAELSESIAVCAQKAMARKQLSRITLYKGNAAIQHNRVLSCSWGGKQGVQSWEMKNWDERSPEVLQRFDEALSAMQAQNKNRLDDTLLLLRICPEAEPDNPSAFIVNYGCHPVSMRPDNLLYSADFPGYLNLSLKETWPHAAVMFINGCCGDINPNIRNGLQSARSNGEALARCIHEMLSQPGIELTGPMMLTEHALNLTYENDYDEYELKRRLSIYQNGLEKAERDNLAEEERIYRTYINWARKMLEKQKSDETMYNIKASVKLLRLNSFSIVALPFELFSGVGLAVKQKLGSSTMICAYAGGDYGYLISEDLFDVSKYERFESYKFMMLPGPVCREAQSLLLNVLPAGDSDT